MAKVRAVLLHFGCCFVGWGIATALAPLLARSEGSSSETPRTLPTKADRYRPDVAGGGRLVERLSKELQLPEASLESRPPQHQVIGQLPSPEEVSFEEGFARIAGFGRNLNELPEDELTRLRNGFIESTVGSLLSYPPRDLLYAFQHGKIGAQQIYDSLATRVPDHALQPAFRGAIYKKIAPLNPGAAEVLLGSCSPEEVVQLKIEALRALDFRFLPGRTPESFLAIFESLPASLDGSFAEQRNTALAEATRHWVAKYDAGDLARWVETLPASQSRNQVAARILSSITDLIPADFNRLRAAIRDPKIQERFDPR